MFGKINKKCHKFLIDSGAQISVVSSDVLRNNKLGSPRFTLSLFSGNEVRTQGVTSLTFQVCFLKFTEQLEVVTTLGTHCSMILGIDFLKIHCAKIDLGRRIVELDGIEVPLGDTATKGALLQGPPKVHGKPVTPQAKSLRLVARSNIPAGTGKVLWIDVTKDLPKGTLCGVEPLVENFELDMEHCFVRRSLVRVQEIHGNKQVPVVVDNFGSGDIDLQKGMLIDNLSVCANEDFDWSMVDQDSATPASEAMLSEKLKHIDEADSKLLRGVIQDFFDLFNPKGPLPETMVTRHRVPADGSRPVYRKLYRVPHHLQGVMEDFIEQQLRDGIIEPSDSPWGAPVIIVPKKSPHGTKKYRFCCDYWLLNSKTIADVYSLPNIIETLDNLGRCRYFSTLDLRSGYHQLEVEPKDRPKSAFNVPTGHYQYRRMPFGLRNAPATFQRLMDSVLRGLKPKQCMVYLDDIIVFPASLEEHAICLREVFKRLHDARLTFNMEKCAFALHEVTYLGHVISKEGVRTDPRLVEAVKNFQTPNSVKEVQSFHGLANYYRRFVENFASIAHPLTQLTRKGAKFEWTPECEEAFKALKEKLIQDSVLI